MGNYYCLAAPSPSLINWREKLGNPSLAGVVSYLGAQGAVMTLVPNNKMIEYLVSRKFGHISKAPPPINSGVANQKMHNEFIAKVDGYKTELSAMKYQDLANQYEQAKAKELEALKLKAGLEEQSRFFNQPYSNADFVHWSKAAHWSIDEAVALSFGKAPNIVNWGKVQPLTSVSKFALDYASRRDLALRALPWKKLYDPVLPSIFLSWAKELQLEIPVELIAEVEKMGGYAINWFEKYQELKKENSELKSNFGELTTKWNELQPLIDTAIKSKQQSNGSSESFTITKLHELEISEIDKPLNIRTENNYLRLIMQFAISYINDFNPKKPYEAAALIKANIDTELSKETIASYIQKAHALDSKERE